MKIIVLGETLAYLRFNCIWPPNGQELKPGELFFAKFISMMFLSTIILIGSSAHLVVSLKNKSSNIIEDIVMILALIGVYYFITTFVLYQKPIARIYLKLSDFQNFEKPICFEAKNQQLQRLSKLYKTFIDLAIICFCLWPFLVKANCENQNKLQDFQEICGLLVTTWFPFDVNSFPIKAILYLWQCWTMLVTMKGAAVISFAIFESMEHLVIRIQHLKEMLKKAVETENEMLRNERLTTCIKYHINIFEIGQKIDKYYTGCLFLHVLLSGALFGCIGYRIMEKFYINAFCILMGWFLSLFIVCISGQHLINEAISVADAVYRSPWYKRDVSFQKKIHFIIMRSQKPIVVHAGPFSYVSHLIILTICKTAYSYLTLLKATSV